jgi:hypothetical protein
MVSTRSIERSNFGGEKRSTAPPPELVARIAKLNREARAAGLIKALPVVTKATAPVNYVRAVLAPTSLTDDTEEVDETDAEDRDVCMCAHCASDGTPEGEYDDECIADDCERCAAMARTRAALAL